MKKKKNNYKEASKTRRDLLKLSAITASSHLVFSPFEIMLDGIFSQFVAKAYAEQVGVMPGRFVYFQHYGAPLRSMYDHFANVNNDSHFKPNKNMATNYKAVGGRYSDVEYSTHNYNGFHIPKMWQSQLPARGNTWVPMTNALDNSMSILGLDAPNAHTIAAGDVLRPSTEFSLLGLISDQSKLPLPALNLNGFNISFKSKTNKPYTKYVPSGSANALKKILSPFDRTATQLISSSNTSLNNKIERAFASLQSGSNKKNSLLASLGVSRKSATELIQSGFDDLGTVWAGLHGKYQELINRSLANVGKLKGFGEYPIGNNTPATRSSMYIVDNLVVRDLDMRNLCRDAQINEMASHFAIAEFMLTRNLSQSLVVRPENIIKTKFATQTGAASSLRGIAYDSHSIGIMPILIATAAHFYAFHSCLNEFISVLKETPSDNQKTLYDSTVIHVGAEFNRKPKVTGGGSDHAGEARSSMLYSGMIDSQIVVGNTKANYSNPIWSGSYGAGDICPELGNIHLNPGHHISTIAKMLDLPSSPSKNNPSLVKKENGKVTAIIPRSKLINNT